MSEQVTVKINRRKMRIFFKDHRTEVLQVSAFKGVTVESFRNERRFFHNILFVLIVTLFQITTYGQSTTKGRPADLLSAQETRYINSLADNSRDIPPWLIAQLLHVSTDLADEFAQAKKELPLIKLNNILAEPTRYKGRVVALKTLFVKSSDVKDPLQLSPGEHCWSVLLLDVKYCKALQLFTTQDPKKFRKNQVFYAIGVFLTTRQDEPLEGDTTQPLTVPVLIGTLLPVETPASPSNSKNFFPFLIVIFFLTVLYIIVRIYVARILKR
jgi:hypothetical protein